MSVFIVPKNTSLNIKCKNVAEEDYSGIKIKEIRGEDIPLFIERSILEGKKYIGITGEDLFKEYTLNNKNTKIGILKRISWDDKKALFNKPVLCLLGPEKKTLKELPKRLKVSINKKYSKIAKKFLSRIQNSYGIIFEKFYFSGSTEEVYVSGLSDLIVDIVYSGETFKKANLEIYEEIFRSDIVVIGKSKENFDLIKLYETIKKGIENKEEKSYSYKISQDLNKIKQKIIEEAGEVVLANNINELVWEISDLIYFLFVLMVKENISIKDIEEENKRRNKETLLNKNRLNNILEEKK